MFITILFFDDQTCDIRSVNAGFTITTFNGKSISAVLAIQTDGAIFAVDDHSRAIFTVDSDGAVFAVRAFFTKIDVIFYIDFIRIGCCSVAFNGGILSVYQLGRIGCDLVFQLIYIDRICTGRTFCHIMDLVAAIIQSVRG